MRRHVLLSLLGAAILVACGARSDLRRPGIASSTGGTGGTGGTDYPCPTRSHEGHLYAFCPDHRTWPDALSFCLSMGMTLLTLGDVAEEDWVYGVEDGFSSEKVWMGFNDRDEEGNFVWVSGAPITYVNWAPDEPNGELTENCGQLNRYFPDHGWNDEPCDFELRFICESP